MKRNLYKIINKLVANSFGKWIQFGRLAGLAIEIVFPRIDLLLVVSSSLGEFMLALLLTINIIGNLIIFTVRFLSISCY